MLGGLFQDLAYYGIRPPLIRRAGRRGEGDPSHQVYWTLYQFSHAAAFSTSIPTDEHMGGSANPQVRRSHRPLWEKEKANIAAVAAISPRSAGAVHGLPDPDALHRAGRPDRRSASGRTFEDEHFNFCSDGCKNIFDHEP